MLDFEHSEESEQRSFVDFKLSWASVFGANVQVMGQLSSLSKCLGAFVMGQISLGQMSLNLYVLLCMFAGKASQNYVSRFHEKMH